MLQRSPRLIDYLSITYPSRMFEEHVELSKTLHSFENNVMLNQKDNLCRNNTPDPEEQRQQNFRLNVGKAMDRLQSQLPSIFHGRSELDFSIFADTITISDSTQHRITIQKSFYITAVKSLKMAAAISSVNPSLRLRKIEYLHDRQEIECLVSVILPDSVTVEGQALWEGYLFFGLNDAGLISRHSFDRKIPPVRPQQKERFHYLFGSWIPQPAMLTENKNYSAKSPQNRPEGFRSKLK